MLAWGRPMHMPHPNAVGVVSARNEAATIQGVVGELRGAGLAEVVVVVNGSDDATAALAEQAGARVLLYPEALGHDVGRSVGTAAVDADIVLYADADFIVPRSQLQPFIDGVAAGVDVALNELSFLYRRYPPTDGVGIGKFFLNRALGRPDLGPNSLTAVPHALSRRAIEVIGRANLSVPPVAQARAILAGLRVQAVGTVDVYSRNRIRPGLNIGTGSESVENLIIGDHLEALALVLQELGLRGGFTDLGRQRQVLAAAPP